MLTNDPRPRISCLSAIREEDLGVYGAKAVSLARLKAWGFDVPRGIAVSFPVDQADEGWDSSFDDRLRREVSDYFRGEVPALAVRSSSPLEDGARFSYAGVFETILGVEGGSALIPAVRKCLGSARSSRARAYQGQAGQSAGNFGVILQEQLRPEYSGVCFTRTHADDSRLVMEWTHGLGEAVVSGRARCARAVVDRRQGEIVEWDDPFETPSPRFSREKILGLSRACLRAEKEWGKSLDLEWAYAGDRLFLLQARPTTHGRVQERRTELRRREIERLRKISGREGHVWTDFSIGDVLPDPSPLIMDSFLAGTADDGGVALAWRALGVPYRRRAYGNALFETVCGRAYINLSEYLETVRGGLPLRVTFAGEPKVGLDPEAGIVARVLAPARFAFRSAGFLRSFFGVRRRFYREFGAGVHAQAVAEARLERARDLTRLDDRALWDLYVAYSARSNREFSRYHLLTDIIAGFTQGMLKAGLKLLYGPGAAAAELELTTGLDGNFNTETNLALMQVARGRRPVADFLEEFGHRANPDWDVAAPRWREDSARVLRMAGKLAESDVDPEARFARQREIRREAERRFARAWRTRPWLWPLQPFFAGCLRYYQLYSPLREATQSVCFLWVELARRTLVEMSRRRGWDELIFFLKRDELARAFANRGAPIPEVARERREDLRLLRTIYLPHFLYPGNLHEIGSPPDLSGLGRELRGRPVCPGYVRGPARVIRRPEDALDLQKGEILVTEFTDPAWTPLFLIAGGLVLEQGSAFSHGAIVAREYGLPALVDVPHATRAIRNGQMLVLDAGRGTVVLE